MIHDPKLQPQDPITPNRLGKDRGDKEMSVTTISGHHKLAPNPTSSTPSAICRHSDGCPEAFALTPITNIGAVPIRKAEIGI